MANKVERPSDVKSERELLAAALKTGQDDVVMAVTTELTPESFAHPYYRMIFTGLAEAVYDSGGDQVSWGDVRARIPEDSQARMALSEMLSENTPPVTPKYVEKLIGKLDNAYKSRRITGLIKSVEARALAMDAQGAYDMLMDGVFEMGRSRFTAGAQPIEHYIDNIKHEVSIRRNAEGVVGLRTGMRPFDEVFGGLQKKSLYYVGGRPGMMKSVVGFQAGYNVAEDGKRVLVCSPEMSAEQYIVRTACKIANLNFDLYNKGRYTEAQEEAVQTAIESMRHKNIIINESGRQSTSSMRQDIIRFKPDLVVVDYMQLFDPTRYSENEYTNTTMFARELNDMKKDFNIPLLVCAQLSRKVEEREDKRPIKSDLRATGQIEQDADGIFMLYREREYATRDEYGDWYREVWVNEDGKNRKVKKSVDPNTIEFVCAKNRNGSREDVMCYVREGELWIRNDR